jgi:uncharacterized protein YeaO (DUF488 family)
MQLWTIQMARWRLAQAQGIHFIDTTVKSGNPAFAPTWDIVLASKSGQMSPQEYTQRYLELMRQSLRHNPAPWEQLQQQEKIALACYCPAGQFCHRLVLAAALTKYLQSKGIAVDARGELLK